LLTAVFSFSQELDDVVPETDDDLEEVQSLSTSTDLQERLAQKQGMNANGAVPREILDLYTKHSSWFYTYGLAPANTPVEWANETGKEFVPLINLKRILPKDESSEPVSSGPISSRRRRACVFCQVNEDCSNKAVCTVDQIVNVLEDTKKKITTRYLMGYNEPYNSHDTEDSKGFAGKGDKGVTGKQGAIWWAQYVQPAAERTGLELVSPTTGISKKKVNWLISFLEACYECRADAAEPCEHSCDVTKIKVFSVHEYKCYANYWKKYASNDGGNDIKKVNNGSCTKDFEPRSDKNLYTKISTAMRAKFGNDKADAFWDPWLYSVKIWVTEHSCSGDYRYDTSSGGETARLGQRKLEQLDTNHDGVVDEKEWLNQPCGTEVTCANGKTAGAKSLLMADEPPADEVLSLTRRRRRRGPTDDEEKQKWWKTESDDKKSGETAESCLKKRWDKKTHDGKDAPLTAQQLRPASPTRQQSCEAITGQDCQHGEGSVKAMLGLDNIERFSWFTLYPRTGIHGNCGHPNYESIRASAMVDDNVNEPTPVGRVLQGNFDPDSAQCDKGPK